MSFVKFLINIGKCDISHSYRKRSLCYFSRILLLLSSIFLFTNSIVAVDKIYKEKNTINNPQQYDYLNIDNIENYYENSYEDLYFTEYSDHYDSNSINSNIYKDYRENLIFKVKASYIHNESNGQFDSNLISDNDKKYKLSSKGVGFDTSSLFILSKYLGIDFSLGANIYYLSKSSLENIQNTIDTTENKQSIASRKIYNIPLNISTVFILPVKDLCCMYIGGG
ncbi:MAG TPA: hypothetical protein QKA14_00080 [Candidatus Megaira endosymbiont of Hartmannula sinica]|nr:hypothetical protein [Candidatus Megaera endosymbiont of Hartmannula sinica]